MTEQFRPAHTCEENTKAENQPKTVDLKRQAEVLGRAWDAIVVSKATSEFFDFGKVFASILPSADTVYKHNEVVETVSQAHCVELKRQRGLKEPIKEGETVSILSRSTSSLRGGCQTMKSIVREKAEAFCFLLMLDAVQESMLEGRNSPT